MLDGVWASLLMVGCGGFFAGVITEYVVYAVRRAWIRKGESR